MAAPEIRPASGDTRKASTAAISAGLGHLRCGASGIAAVVRPEAWLGETSRRLLGWLWMISVVLVGWVFFRSTSVANAIVTLRNMVDPGPVSYFTLKMLGLASVELVMLVVSLAMLLVVDFHLAFRPQRLQAFGEKRWLSTGVGVAMAYYIILFGIFGHAEFIYFQF